MKFRYRRSYNCLIAFALAFLISLIALAVNGLAPFGMRTLGNISEYDSVEYVRAVVSGRQNAFYSFSGTAGSGVFYLLSEVLFSPATFIMALSNPSSFETVYDLLFILKVALAAGAMAAFINYRFFTGKNIDTTKFEFKHIGCICVSLLYAFCGISWSAGIAVAEGAIFLPLILLGVYKTAADKGAQMFMISLLINLVFHWYTGFFNGIIAIFWMIFEMLLQIVGSQGFVKQLDLNMIATRLVRFLVSLMLAAGSTCAIWFCSLKLTPDAKCDSVFTAMVNFPGICMTILGALGMIYLLLMNNCRYTIKITVVAFTLMLCITMLTPTIITAVAGNGTIDVTVRPLRYVLALMMIFIFALTFFTYNNFSKRKYVNYFTAGVTAALMIAGLITCVFVPLNKTYKDMPDQVNFNTRSQIYKTLIAAVRDLDKGAYRIGFVSDDLNTVTLLSSNDDYVYFDDAEYKIDAAGDIAGVLYPYSVKYLISTADLREVSGSEEPLGEAEGYKVYLNNYYMPMAYVYDGSYFDMEFRSADTETRAQMARTAREHVASAVSVKASDMKFMCEGSQGEELFVSVPADSHMSIDINGVKYVPKLYEGRFYTITLSEGTNTITMNYLPEFFTETLVISIIALILLMLFIFIENFYDMYYPER